MYLVHSPPTHPRTRHFSLPPIFQDEFNDKELLTKIRLQKRIIFLIKLALVTLHSDCNLAACFSQGKEIQWQHELCKRRAISGQSQALTQSGVSIETHYQARPSIIHQLLQHAINSHKWAVLEDIFDSSCSVWWIKTYGNKTNQEINKAMITSSS